MSKQHSDFPASSAKRLLECPASYAETKKLPAGAPRRTSRFAVEGTVAHTLAEQAIVQHDANAFMLNTLGTKMELDGFEIFIDEEMLEHAELYVSTVRGYEALGFEVELEQRVSPDWLWSPNKPPIELFGTSDTVAFNPATGELVIVDLKYGRGIPVEVEWNAQLLYYALGALREVTIKHGKDAIKSVQTVIVQPRAPHPDGPVRSWKYTPGQLVQWGFDTLKAGVDLVAKGKNLPFKAGDHCKFCPVLGVCPELTRAAQDTAAAVFANKPPAPTREEILRLVTILEPWIDAAKQDAHDALEQGVAINGWKLVQKRATRKWDDSNAVARVGGAFNLTVDDLFGPPEVLSPAQLLGSKKVKTDPALLAELNKHVVSVSSGTTLAPASDPRPAVPARPAAKDVFSVDPLNPLEL
jgi:hypothetical protein